MRIEKMQDCNVATLPSLHYFICTKAYFIATKNKIFLQRGWSGRYISYGCSGKDFLENNHMRCNPTDQTSIIQKVPKDLGHVRPHWLRTHRVQASDEGMGVENMH